MEGLPARETSFQALLDPDTFLTALHVTSDDFFQRENAGAPAGAAPPGLHNFCVHLHRPLGRADLAFAELVDW